jgi:hypothetical protein
MVNPFTELIQAFAGAKIMTLTVKPSDDGVLFRYEHTADRVAICRGCLCMGLLQAGFRRFWGDNGFNNPVADVEQQDIYE